MITPFVGCLDLGEEETALACVAIGANCAFLVVENAADVAACRGNVVRPLGHLVGLGEPSGDSVCLPNRADADDILKDVTFVWFDLADCGKRKPQQAVRYQITSNGAVGRFAEAIMHERGRLRKLPYLILH